jgi:hypothetical protein
MILSSAAALATQVRQLTTATKSFCMVGTSILKRVREPCSLMDTLSMEDEGEPKTATLFYEIGGCS